MFIINYFGYTPKIHLIYNPTLVFVGVNFTIWLPYFKLQPVELVLRF